MTGYFLNFRVFYSLQALLSASVLFATFAIITKKNNNNKLANTKFAESFVAVHLLDYIVYSLEKSHTLPFVVDDLL